MPGDQQQGLVELPIEAAPGRFVAENARLAGLSGCEAVPQASATQGLADGIWLSTEPDSGAELAFEPRKTGFALTLTTVGKSHWVSLSFRLSIDTLRTGRYLCFLIRTTSHGFLSYRPCLRFLRENGFTDHFARDYMVSSDGESEQLSYIAIDRARQAQANAAEVHLFFQGSNFRTEIHSIEALLIG